MRDEAHIVGEPERHVSGTKLRPVAEKTEQTEATAPAPTKSQLSAARAFVATHGKPSRGVIEPIGRAGSRVVLVGGDGAMGDVIVRSVEAGEALIDAVEGLERAEWDSETVGAAVIGPRHRRRMGRSLLRA